MYQGDSGDMVEHTRQVHVDFFLFIKLTVCPALAMVKDSKEDTGRTTDRVNILLELIHQELKGMYMYQCKEWVYFLPILFEYSITVYAL